jgi:hypothetical protein
MNQKVEFDYICECKMKFVSFTERIMVEKSKLNHIQESGMKLS